jgi:hypothetical protein
MTVYAGLWSDLYTRNLNLTLTCYDVMNLEPEIYFRVILLIDVCACVLARIAQLIAWKYIFLDIVWQTTLIASV